MFPHVPSVVEWLPEIDCRASHDIFVTETGTGPSLLSLFAMAAVNVDRHRAGVQHNHHWLQKSVSPIKDSQTYLHLALIMAMIRGAEGHA